MEIINLNVSGSQPLPKHTIWYLTLKFHSQGHPQWWVTHALSGQQSSYFMEHDSIPFYDQSGSLVPLSWILKKHALDQVSAWGVSS